MKNEIPQKVRGAFTQSGLQNRSDLVRPAYTNQTVRTVNFRAGTKTNSNPVQPKPQQSDYPPSPHPVQVQPVSAPQTVPSQPTAPAIKVMTIPQLPNLLRKGQKAPLDAQNMGIRHVTLGFGWNVRDARCDLDASAFLVTDTGKVSGDDWFVFYGQDKSPDGSVAFSQGNADREIITVDFTRLDPHIRKIIFVLTINEAFQQKLNFSMICDPYVRIMDTQTGHVLLSYKMEDLYANVTSMTIGELYLHNGIWKFNPVGNGVQQDLAGQCAIYGVQIE